MFSCAVSASSFVCLLLLLSLIASRAVGGAFVPNRRKPNTVDHRPPDLPDHVVGSPIHHRKFGSHINFSPWKLHQKTVGRADTRLHFFRRGRGSSTNEEEEPDDNDYTEKKEENENQDETTATKRALVVPFFSRFGRKVEEAEEDIPTTATTTVTAASVSSSSPVPTQTAAKAKESSTAVPSPEERAAALRAQAEKARLEAERMDAELTLQKIEKLEKRISSARKKSDSDADALENMQREMDALRDKLRGEAGGPTSVASNESGKRSNSASSSSAVDAAAAAAATTPVAGSSAGAGAAAASSVPSSVSATRPFDEKQFQENISTIQAAPSFLKKILAAFLNVDYTSETEINATELALKLDQVDRLDFSDSELPPPVFTQAQINDKVREIKDDPDMLELLLPGSYDNATDAQRAVALLETEYYLMGGKTMESLEDSLIKIAEDEEWLQPIIERLNQTSVDRSIEVRFPDCTRKEDNGPTEADVTQLCKEILPKAEFSLASKPEKVFGGYLIRGKASSSLLAKKKTDEDSSTAAAAAANNGDAVIDAIDEQLALSSSSLKDKLTVIYIEDFTKLASIADMGEDMDIAEFDGLMGEADPILYVMGKNICRDRPDRLLRSAVSAGGLATCWYLSIYPFLMNTGIAERVEDQLALAENNMTPDLGFLTELSVPLFVTFVTLQLLHEAGHRLAAAVHNFEITFPTFVPSLITGITSSVTQFKTPPKNKNAMFDFAVAGPLLGMAGSLAAIAAGSRLTLSTAAESLPALPLDILRQSTLGGAVINAILGDGTLYLSDAMRDTEAVASMTVQLHPLAIAGYISLLINALSMLPIGTTDGGRMAMTLFGREVKLAVGDIMVFVLLVLGFFGSDLFLFYSAFCIAFQSGNEIPARNEVDQLSFSRILVATAAYFLCILSLVPFQ